MDAKVLLGQTIEPHSRLLVVEDDPIVRDFCVRLLRMKGYHVQSAENGRIALSLLQHTPFDLILTDLQMPEMGGIPLLHELQRLHPSTDSIVFTAFATVETARAALKLGAFDYLTKPVSVDDLERTVRRALEWRNIRREKQRLSDIIQLYEFSKTFTGTLDTTTAVGEIIGVLRRRFAPAHISLSLFHPDDEQLELLALSGGDHTFALLRTALPSESDETALLVAHHRLAGAAQPIDMPHLAQIVLRSNDRQVGVLELTRAPDQPGFDADDRTMLAICASQIAASLDNSRLYQQLRAQNLQTVIALAAAIDARDPYTRGHSEQVMRYAVRLAEQIGLVPEQIERVRYGALLHDIGKIGVRDSILLKPGSLSDDEYTAMRRHPTIGAEIIGGIKELRPLIAMVEHHHERIDGRGYPDGLRADTIPIEARILSIADAFDTMTSERAYRRALSAEKAFAELEAGRGSQWDTRLVDLFIAIINREWRSLRVAGERVAQQSVEG